MLSSGGGVKMTGAAALGAPVGFVGCADAANARQAAALAPAMQRQRSRRKVPPSPNNGKHR
jgi:hypothetical protein